MTFHYLARYRRLMPTIEVLPAVNGFNHTETISALLDSGLGFHDLSRGGRKWGMLGCVLSHYRSLQYQVQHKIPFQLTLEDDLRLNRASFGAFVERACALLDAAPNVTILQLSLYTEIRLTSYEGARHLLQVFDEVGIRKNIDQMINIERTLGDRHKVRRWLAPTKWKPRPWVLGRTTNSATGHIWRSRRMTWTELAMLRLLTRQREARLLPRFGNPSLRMDKASTWAT